MAWISAVNMDALSGKRHFRVWVRDTQADATFGPSFEPSVYIYWKSGYWDDSSWNFALKMNESVVSFLSVVSVKSTSGCFIVQGGILSIELDWIFRTVIPAEFRAGAFRIPNVGIALGDNQGTSAQHSHHSMTPGYKYAILAALSDTQITSTQLYIPWITSRIPVRSSITPEWHRG